MRIDIFNVPSDGAVYRGIRDAQIWACRNPKDRDQWGPVLVQKCHVGEPGRPADFVLADGRTVKSEDLRRVVAYED